MNSITTQPKPTCDLCGAPGDTAQGGIVDPDGKLPGEWSFRRCSNPECGVYWLDPALPKDELWKAYTSYHTHARRSGSKLTRGLLSLAHRWVRFCWWPIWLVTGLKREADYLRYMTLAAEPTGRLLDVGCGAGRFLHRMQRRGWQVEGIDFDEQAAAKVTRKYGIKAHVGSLADCSIPDASFDVVTMSQTVEHLFDPRSDLQACLRVLKPGGLLVMTTPNVNSIGAAEFGPYWRGWEPPRHLHLFSVESLARLTRQAGFEIDEARSYSTGSAVVYRVSQTLRRGGKSSFLSDLRAFSWSYVKELTEYQTQSSRPGSGQNVLVRARKPLV